MTEKYLKDCNKKELKKIIFDDFTTLKLLTVSTRNAYKINNQKQIEQYQDAICKLAEHIESVIKYL